VPPLLDRLTLNRALLARQHLLERSDLAVPAMVEHLVGMQAQLPEDPYLGLWSRIDDFDPEALSTLIAERKAVRIALMRSTIHLVTAADAPALRALTQEVLERTLRSNQLRLLEGVDLAELGVVARGLVEERPRATPELGRLLAVHWPERDSQTLMIAARAVLPLVQVPPRGLWGGRGQPTVTTLDSWLGRPASDAAPFEEGPSREHVVLRYLRAFGPASSADMRTWSGLTRVRDVFERLRPSLHVYRDERGRELFDVPDGLFVDPGTPAPIRFLPVYDNRVLSHEDRSRVVPPEVGSALPIGQENVGSVLIGGFVGARWRIRRERRSIAMTIELMRSVMRSTLDEVEAEGRRALGFLARETSEQELVVRPFEG
jgi:hypothetical protein